MRACIHTYIHPYMRAYMCSYIHMYICTYVSYKTRQGKISQDYTYMRTYPASMHAYTPSHSFIHSFIHSLIFHSCTGAYILHRENCKHVLFCDPGSRAAIPTPTILVTVFHFRRTGLRPYETKPSSRIGPVAVTFLMTLASFRHAGQNRASNMATAAAGNRDLHDCLCSLAAQSEGISTIACSTNHKQDDNTIRRGHSTNLHLVMLPEARKFGGPCFWHPFPNPGPPHRPHPSTHLPAPPPFPSPPQVRIRT